MTYVNTVVNTVVNFQMMKQGSSLCAVETFQTSSFCVVIIVTIQRSQYGANEIIKAFLPGKIQKALMISLAPYSVLFVKRIVLINSISYHGSDLTAHFFSLLYMFAGFGLCKMRIYGAQSKYQRYYRVCLIIEEKLPFLLTRLVSPKVQYLLDIFLVSLRTLLRILNNEMSLMPRVNLHLFNITFCN